MSKKDTNPSPVYTARWTCQCGETGVSNGESGALSVAAAATDGQRHQVDNGCPVVGVWIRPLGKISDLEEDNDG